MEESEHILSTIKNGIQKVIINRPKKRNAITPGMYKRLTTLLQQSSEDDNVQIFLLTGTGSFFSSGTDTNIPHTDNNSNSNPSFTINLYKQFVDALILYPKLLIAFVNGPAIGIAATILGIFDMVYATDKAYFLTPFSALNLTAEGCSTYTFPRIMGNSKAGEMLYFGYKMNAHEAKECGLISGIFKDENFHEFWTYLINKSILSSESIQESKRLVKRWNKKILMEANTAEADALIQRWTSLGFKSNQSKL